MKNSNRIEIEDEKFLRLSSFIAKSVKCTPDYVRKVLNGKAGKRKTELSVSIQKKYEEFMKLIQE